MAKMLQRPGAGQEMKKPVGLPKGLAKGSNADKMVGVLISEMMNASTLTHKLHLKINGPASYARHMALATFYDEIKELADSLAEQYQGHKLILLETEEAPYDDVVLKSNEDGIDYLNDLYMLVHKTQEVMTCSSIINEMDNIKALINSTKYKLHFLA